MVELSQTYYRLGEILTVAGQLQRIEQFDQKGVKTLATRAAELLSFQAEYIRDLKLKLAGQVDPGFEVLNQVDALKAEIERLKDANYNLGRSVAKLNTENEGLKERITEAGWQADFRRNLSF
jgi:FtsZ-binding cell division protein ZapB